jgi:hypothetical protein
MRRIVHAARSVPIRRTPVAAPGAWRPIDSPSHPIAGYSTGRVDPA